MSFRKSESNRKLARRSGGPSILSIKSIPSIEQRITAASNPNDSADHDSVEKQGNADSSQWRGGFDWFDKFTAANSTYVRLHNNHFDFGLSPLATRFQNSSTGR